MWIEQHGRQHRVVWRTAAGRDVEPFATRDDAERFRLAAGLLSRGVEEARALVRGPAHAPEQVPATLAVATAARPTRPRRGDRHRATDRRGHVHRRRRRRCADLNCLSSRGLLNQRRVQMPDRGRQSLRRRLGPGRTDPDGP